MVDVIAAARVVVTAKSPQGQKQAIAALKVGDVPVAPRLLEPVPDPEPIPEPEPQAAAEPEPDLVLTEAEAVPTERDPAGAKIGSAGR